jgi:RNA polymerase-binding transcription factor DksA
MIQTKTVNPTLVRRLAFKGIEIPDGKLTYSVDSNDNEYWSKSSLAVFEALLLLKKSELETIKPQPTLSKGSPEDRANAETLNNTSYSLANRAVGALVVINQRLEEIKIGIYGTFQGKVIDVDRLIAAPMSARPILEKMGSQSPPARITTHVYNHTIA